MKISELQSILTKASQLLGDAPVILKKIEEDGETFVKGLEVLVTSGDPSDAGTVTLLHSTEAPEPAPDPTPAA